jgi:DNA-binding CsgD family transcriptional regulator
MFLRRGKMCSAMRESESKDLTDVGLILLNAQLRPLQHNAEAATILCFPEKGHHVRSLASIIPSRVMDKGLSGVAASTGVEFVSGRRRYVCRMFLFDVMPDSTSLLRPRVVVLLERRRTSGVDLRRWSEAMNLTSRELQTVELLLKGLTSREIAHEMGISTNTVTSFLSLVMAKVGAATRTELLVKLLERAS